MRIARLIVAAALIALLAGCGQGPKGDAGAPGPQGPASPSAFRVVSDSAQASCGAGEIMASAYCAGGNALHIDGTTGASCDGGAKAVIVCARQ